MRSQSARKQKTECSFKDTSRMDGCHERTLALARLLIKNPTGSICRTLDPIAIKFHNSKVSREPVLCFYWLGWGGRAAIGLKSLITGAVLRQ